MEQLASSLTEMIPMAEGYDATAKKPRGTDKTGLTGKYDFLLEFRCQACAGWPGPEQAAAERAGAAVPTASDPLGDSSLPNIFNAFEQQLGLRLVKTKDVPVDVLVIDHVDRLPTPN